MYMSVLVTEVFPLCPYLFKLKFIFLVILDIVNQECIFPFVIPDIRDRESI